MRLLLDESVPRLGPELVGHEVATGQEQGWGGMKNGELLALAAPEFDVVLTVDQGIPIQQNRPLSRRGAAPDTHEDCS